MPHAGRSFALAVALALAAGAAAAQAPAYPAKPVRIINPFAPGGATDQIARLTAQKLSELWGQSVVVENRPGASGAIGLEAVAKSPPDGYTLAIATQTTHAANPALYAKLPYDPVRDFAPLTLAGSTPLALLVQPSLPVTDAKTLIAYLKSNPGKLTYASGGNGTSQHLTMELLKSMTGTFVVHIPYRGAGPAMVDFLGGQVNLMFDNLPTAMPHVKSGKLRALAVSTARRSALAPEVPTMAESGLAGFDLATWFAFFAPAATLKEVTAKIAADMQRVLAQPDVRERLLAAGVDVAGSTPEELARFQRAEMEKWARIVRDSGAKVD
jgi:tripartite-type tricarboxylate transporter receptor subunit TctC